MLRRDHVCEFGHFLCAGKTRDALVRKLDDAVCHGIQRVVAALGNVQTRADHGTALADDNVAGFGAFTGIQLHAKALTLGIAAVTCRTTCFFVCHRDG